MVESVEPLSSVARVASVVGMVVGWVVGLVVSVVGIVVGTVSIGALLRQPQPVRTVTVRTNARIRNVYFFILFLNWPLSR